MPEAIRQEAAERLDALGDTILAEQKSSGRFKSQTGALRNALSKRVTPKTLKLKVGLVGKPINRKLYYGLILQVGRKGGGRGVKRGSAKYNAGVGRRAPDPFVWSKSTQKTVNDAARAFRGFWDSVLLKAARGASDE